MECYTGVYNLDFIYAASCKAVYDNVIQPLEKLIKAIDAVTYSSGWSIGERIVHGIAESMCSVCDAFDHATLTFYDDTNHVGIVVVVDDGQVRVYYAYSPRSNEPYVSTPYYKLVLDCNKGIIEEYNTLVLYEAPRIIYKIRGSYYKRKKTTST